MYLCRKIYRERKTTREEKGIIKIMEERRINGGNKKERRTSERNYPPESESELLYDWRFIANQFVLATSPSRLTTSNFFQLNPCGCSSL
jgi:hypothetical protein